MSVLALLAAPLAANATSITYDFTAAVDSATGSLSSLFGGLISGTMTFDPDNADPALSSGSTGTFPLQNWTRAEHTGSAFQLPPSNSYVFSMTASLGSTLLYSTGAAGTYSSQSSIQGGEQGGLYSASETQADDPTGLNSRTATFLLTSSPPQFAYDSNGLPNFGATNHAGSFTIELNGVSSSVGFDILGARPAPVPLPAAAWLLVSGLGGLGALARRKAA
jgi:hypothetical protein